MGEVFGICHGQRCPIQHTVGEEDLEPRRIGRQHVWFERNYQDSEADRKRRLGAEADTPHRIDTGK